MHTSPESPKRIVSVMQRSRAIKASRAMVNYNIDFGSASSHLGDLQTNTSIAHIFDDNLFYCLALLILTSPVELFIRLDELYILDMVFEFIQWNCR